MSGASQQEQKPLPTDQSAEPLHPQQQQQPLAWQPDPQLLEPPSLQPLHLTGRHQEQQQQQQHHQQQPAPQPMQQRPSQVNALLSSEAARRLRADPATPDKPPGAQPQTAQTNPVLVDAASTSFPDKAST